MERLDFASALYLGMTHPSALLRPFPQLTTGVPMALGKPPGAARVEAALSALVGCQRTALYPSTLHLYWDLFGLLARDRIAVHVDASAYPITRYGVERAAARGAMVRAFAHHDASALRASLERAAQRGVRAVVVADGICGGCGASPPLGEYARAARAFGGLLIVDDTQALGLVGDPRGGGGGSLRHHRVGGNGVLLGSSLAKGLGAPVAALSGPERLLRAIETRSETRVHTSPPSVAAIHAAEHALVENARRGDALRARLRDNIAYFQRRLRCDGWVPEGGEFPVQTLAEPEPMARALHTRIAARGVRAILFRSRCAGGVRLGFVITAAHRLADLDRGVDTLAAARRDLHGGRTDAGLFAKEMSPCG